MYGKSPRIEHEPQFQSAALLHVETGNILRTTDQLQLLRSESPRCVVRFLLSLVNVAADQGVALTQKF